MSFMGLRTVLAIAALALPGFAAGQAGGDGDRASTPPGTARDGSAPGHGAIKGGAILPGESGGTPDATTPPSAAARCYELTGTLREQCLRDARGAGVGGSADPRVAPNVRDPAMAPPPQNPR
jgi:hypothetical protein